MTDGPGAAASRTAGEHAALRRVAELVATGGPQAAVLDAIVAEASELFAVDFAALLRYDPDGPGSVVAVHNGPPGLAVGERAPDVPDGLLQRTFRSRRPTCVDAYADLGGSGIGRMHQLGITAGAAAPILVEGRLWGVLAAMVLSGSVVAGLEDHLAEYADLAAIAVAAAQAKDQLRHLADEQAALRRVAELAAQGAEPEVVFAAMAVEASALLRGTAITIASFDGDRDGTVSIVARGGDQAPCEQGGDAMGDVLAARVRRRGDSVRIDHDGAAGGREASSGEPGPCAGAAVPVAVEDRLWGVLTAISGDGPLPHDVTSSLSQFAEIAAAAIATAETRAELRASRARVVATADEARRRLQRDVHDGAEQRLVQTIITLKVARATAHQGRAADALIDEALFHAERANTELRRLVHGILPASLSEGGLRVGVQSLIDDIDIPVHLHVTATHLPAETETTAYFIIAEALTNVVKHAQASRAQVSVELDGDVLRLDVRDDGLGGADPTQGSGLTGLSDRVAAAEGTLTITSPVARGTTLHVTLPVAVEPTE